jgi:CheY-like chemotaxis protein
VQDSGIGISADKIGRLFKPFAQAERSTVRQYGGTGLGLAICDGLVQAFGGAITVQSQPGNGSTFLFTLPCNADAAPHPEPEKQKSLEGAPLAVSSDTSLAERAPLRILLAEDNPVNQKVGRRVLERLGYSIDTATNGLEVLERLRNEFYDLILMDVNLPEMDGLEATRHIRRLPAAYAQPCIVAVTAAATSGDRAQCLEAGMDNYISKPFTLAELGRLLEQIYSERQAEAANNTPLFAETALSMEISMEVSA